MTRERGDLDAVPPDANASPYPLIARQGIGKGVPKRFLTWTGLLRYYHRAA
jgi:hypothetical protein